MSPLWPVWWCAVAGVLVLAVAACVPPLVHIETTQTVHAPAAAAESRNGDYGKQNGDFPDDVPGLAAIVPDALPPGLVETIPALPASEPEQAAAPPPIPAPQSERHPLMRALCNWCQPCCDGWDK